MAARMTLAMLVVLIALPAWMFFWQRKRSWEEYNDAGREAMEQARYAEAEELYLAALKEAESFGGQDTRLVRPLNDLAELYRVQGKYAEAEPLFQRSLAIREKALGREHPHVAIILENYASLLREMDRNEEAEKLEERARAIRGKAR